MEIRIEKAALLKALDRVRSVIEGRNTIPILSNVLLAVEGGQLTITATDLDMESSAVAFTADLATQPGQLTVPGNMMYDLVRKLPDGAEVLLRHDASDHRLLITAGRSKFNLPVLPAGDFPAYSIDGLGAEHTVSAPDLAKMIEAASFCMSTEETRYYLNGLYLHVPSEKPGVLRAVATDGHRLATAEMACPDGMEGIPGVIIPRKTVKEVRRMLDGVDTVTIQVTATKVRFVTPAGSKLTSKIIDGNFPDYMRVIPTGNEHRITVDPMVLSSAVDRVATISAEKSRSAKFAFGDGLVTITVRNMEAGQGVEQVEVDYDGPSVEIGFNARYVLDVMGRIKAGSAILEVGDPASPCLVLDTENDAVRFVLMPLRV